MKVKYLKMNNVKLKPTIKEIGLRCLLILLLGCFYASPVSATEQWPGVDKTVVEKYAKEYGREAKDPLINTDQGDLLLFVFLTAGAVGGFIAGYYWRLLTEKSGKEKEN